MPTQTIKNSLFDESLADKQVIINLTKELYRRKLMPIVKTVDGKYYRVEEGQEVTAEDAQAELTLLQSKVSELEAVLAPADPAASQDNTNNGQANPTDTQTPPEGQPGQPAANAAADPGAVGGSDAATPPAPDPNNLTPPADPNASDITLQ